MYMYDNFDYQPSGFEPNASLWRMDETLKLNLQMFKDRFIYFCAMKGVIRYRSGYSTSVGLERIY